MSPREPRPEIDPSADDRASRLRVAGVAHDVNQMLAVIRGRAEAMLRRLPAEQEHLRAIALAAADASAMLERLGGHGTAPGTGVIASPRAALDEAALLVLPPSGAWAEGAGGPGSWRLDNRIDPAVGVRVPPNVLREVLVNLLRNALAAMPGGGSVVADARTAGGVVAVRVADDGPGLDPAVAARLFEAGVTTSAGVGHGIGLASCRQLLADHGATLTVDDAVDRGAAFVVGAPAGAFAAAPGPARPGVTAPAPLAAPGVVVIDDEAAMRDMLRDVLGELGCAVRCHRDGAAALAPGALDGAAVALVDRRLAGQDGVAVAARLRERDPRLVIVLMSGWDRDELPAPGADVDFTVRKPLALDSLQDLLARAAVLHRQRGGQEGRS